MEVGKKPGAFSVQFSGHKNSRKRLFFNDLRLSFCGERGIAYGTTVSVTTKTVDGKDPWEPTAPDENGAVDLGLSVKWAAYNVGATKPEEYGDYYAWGEVETKEDYAETNYEFTNVDQYGDYYQVLPGGFSDISKTQYDPATVN